MSFDWLVFTSDCSMALNRILLSSWTSCCCSSSLLPQPKLSVSRFVEQAFWSRRRSSANRRCSSIGITLTLDLFVVGLRPSSSGLRLNNFSLENNLTDLLTQDNKFLISSWYHTSEFRCEEKSLNEGVQIACGALVDYATEVCRVAFCWCEGFFAAWMKSHVHFSAWK